MMPTKTLTAVAASLVTSAALIASGGPVGATTLPGPPGIPSPSAASDAAASTARSAPAVAWTWRWSDGGTQHRRTFSKRVYGTAANLPYLIISNDACASGILLKLQFRENGRYITEDRTVTRGCRSAKLHFNPYTESGKWAVGVYKERVMIPGIAYHYFTIEYTR